MRGTFTFKPVKANLTHDTELLTKMDPYCSFTLGTQKFKTQICKSGGKNPVWNDEIQVPIETDQQFCYLQLLDQDRLSKDDNIGTATIDLFEIMNNTNRFVSKWYPLFYKNKSAGEILIEIGFNPSGQGFGNQPFASGTQGVGYGQSGIGTQGIQGSQGYGQSGLGTQGIQGSQGYSHNVPLSTGQTGYGQSGLGTGVGQTGYSQGGLGTGTGIGTGIGTGTGIGQTGYGQSGYGQGGLGTTNIGQTGLGSNIGGTGFSGQSIPQGTHTSVEDPLYGKTVDVKSAGGYGSTGYSGSNLGYQQGGTLGQGSNLGYQQGSTLGQGGNVGYQQGITGTREQGGGLLGKVERAAENFLNTNVPNPNVNPTQQQFTQPGYH